MKKTFLLMFFLIFSVLLTSFVIVFSQQQVPPELDIETILISGRLINGLTGSPVANNVIQYVETGSGKNWEDLTQTDSDGYFTAKIPAPVSPNYARLWFVWSNELMAGELDIKPTSANTFNVIEDTRPDHCEQKNLMFSNASMDVDDIKLWPTARFYAYTVPDQTDYGWGTDPDGYRLMWTISQYDECCPNPDTDPYACRGWFGGGVGYNRLQRWGTAGETFKIFIEKQYTNYSTGPELTSYYPLPTNTEFINDKFYVIKYDQSANQLTTSVCGDGVCDDIENTEICPKDCGAPATTTTIPVTNYITVTGRLVNAHTQQPVPNVEYDVSNCEKWFKINTRTDSDGKFTARVPLSSNYCGRIWMGAHMTNSQQDVVYVELRSDTPGIITIDKSNRPDHCEEDTKINADTTATRVNIGDVYTWPTARFYLYTTEDKSKNGYPLHVTIHQYDRCCPDTSKDPYECWGGMKSSGVSSSGRRMSASVAGEKFKVKFSEFYKPGFWSELKSYEPFETTDDFISKLMYVVRYDVQNDVIDYSVCNDGTCDSIENAQICPEDCGGVITTTVPISYGQILIDESHGESSTTDICGSGGCNFGQYEVKEFLENAGFKVDVNKVNPLTYEKLSRYKMLILNGKYAGPVQSFTEEEIKAIRSFVTNGGGLLVTCGGSQLGTGDCWELYNPLISLFGGTSFKSDSYLGGYDREAKFVTTHTISQGLDQFYIIHGVEVVYETGQIIAESDKIPVLVTTEPGRGRVVVAGMGSGFMGQLLNSNNEEKIASNKKLLINIASWLMGRTIEKKENCPYECCIGNPEYLDRPCPTVRCPPCVVREGVRICPPCEQPRCVRHQCILQPSDQEYILRLKVGWNMFSFPVDVNIRGTTQAGTATKEVGVAEAITGQITETTETVPLPPEYTEPQCPSPAHVWHYSNGRYIDVAEDPRSIVNGLGYWVKMEYDCIAKVRGQKITIEDFSELETGWNQIGAPSGPVNFYSVIGNCNLLSGPWWYNSALKKYEKAQVLRPGEGYWIKVKDKCSLGSEIPPLPPEELSIISKALRIG